MGPQTHMVVFGVLDLEGKKVLLPLRNKSILTELKRGIHFLNLLEDIHMKLNLI